MGKKSNLSPRKVAEVKLLPKETTYSHMVIASKLKISQKSVSRIKVCLLDNASYGNNRAGKCGAKPILTPRSKRKLVSLSLRNRQLSSKELSDQMKQDGTAITPKYCQENPYQRRATSTTSKKSGKNYSKDGKSKNSVVEEYGTHVCN